MPAANFGAMWTNAAGVRERALQGMDDATRAQLTRLLEQARDNLLSQD